MLAALLNPPGKCTLSVRRLEKKRQPHKGPPIRSAGIPRSPRGRETDLPLEMQIGRRSPASHLRGGSQRAVAGRRTQETPKAQIRAHHCWTSGLARNRVQCTSQRVGRSGRLGQDFAFAPPAFEMFSKRTEERDESRFRLKRDPASAARAEAPASLQPAAGQHSTSPLQQSHGPCPSSRASSGPSTRLGRPAGRVSFWPSQQCPPRPTAPRRLGRPLAGPAKAYGARPPRRFDGYHRPGAQARSPPASPDRCRTAQLTIT